MFSVFCLRLSVTSVLFPDTTLFRSELDRTFGETHGALAVIEILRGAGNRAQRRADIALRLDPQTLSGQLAKVLLESRSDDRSEEHTSELQSLRHLVCRLLL